MSRYLGPVRFDFRGDVETARRYIPAARLLIGEIEAIGYFPASKRREYREGVVLHATVAPPVRHAVIDVTRADGMIAGRGTIVTPRDEASPDGSSTDWPQMIIVPEPKFATGVLLADANEPKYGALAAPKGVYLPRFALGVKYFGNIDWKGKNDERLSWYGPYSRYWPDRKFFSVTNTPFVFSNGEILLYGPAVSANPVLAGDVRGAALWMSNGVKFMHVIHQTGDVHSLVRYALARDATPVAQQNAAITGFEIVGSITLQNSLTPWFFNASGNRAVHMTDPLHLPSDDPLVFPQANTVARLTLSSTGVPSFSTSNATMAREYNDVLQSDAYLAIDYDGDREVSMRVRRSQRQPDVSIRTDRTFNMVHDENTFAVDVVLDVDGTRLATSTHGQFITDNGAFAETFLYADLRDWLILSAQFNHDDAGIPELNYNLYRNGQIVFRKRHALGYTPPLSTYFTQRWTPVGEQPSWAPRFVLTHFVDVTMPEPFAWGPLFGCYGMMSYPLHGNDNWTTHPELYHDDTFGVPQVGVSSVENERVIFSFAVPRVTGDLVDTRQAINYMTGGSLSGRLLLSAEDSACFPGAPLGRSIF